MIGLATGYAIGRGEPAMAILHTTAGLGNGVAALATARVNRAPLVVLVGQQDRRHLVQEPFLAGRLRGLAGEYPVSYEEPVRPQDVPGALARAYHAARAARGPALVVVPMDDWLAPAPEPHEIAAPAHVIDAHAAHPDALDALADLLAEAQRPALVVGAGADDPDGWAGLTQLAERLDSPVFTEAFGARAGFPQDHPLFAGHLSPARKRVREMLAGHDVVLVVGAPVLRQYAYEPGRAVRRGHPRRGGHRRSGGGAPRGRRAGRRGPAGRRLRGTGRARRRPRGRRPPAAPGAAGARAARPGRAAARRPPPGRAGRAPARATRC